MEPLRSGLGFQKRRKRLLLSQGSANPVLPTQIGSVAAWYRYGQGITQAGGFASAWADQSGNGRNLLQAAGVNQPAVNADGSLLFDGVNSWMQTAFTLNSPFCYAVLVRQVSWLAGEVIINGVTAPAGIQQIGATTLGVRASSNVNTPAVVGPSGYCVMLANFSSTTLRMRVNNLTDATGGANTNNAGGITLAASISGATQRANVEFKEVVVFSISLDATQRQLMVNYLASVGNLVI